MNYNIYHAWSLICCLHIRIFHHSWWQWVLEISRLIIKSSFHIYFLTCLSTWYQCRDLTRYQSRVESELADSTRFIKQSNMMSRELNIEIFPVFRLYITFLHYLWIFVNYMQNDWAKWLSKVKFIINNTSSLITLTSLFLINLSQNSCLNFKSFKFLLENLMF